MKLFNKKGMMDDFFDFMFTVFAAFFLLLFIGLILNSSTNSRNEDSLQKLEDYNNQEMDLFHKIILFEMGTKIIDCKNYNNEFDCNNDILEIKKDLDQKCNWNEDSKKCELTIPSVSVNNLR